MTDATFFGHSRFILRILTIPQITSDDEQKTCSAPSPLYITENEPAANLVSTMNEANDRGEQVAQHQGEGALDITHCRIEKGSGAMSPSLRMETQKNGTVEQPTSQSQLKEGPEQTAAHDPPLPVGKASVASGMPPTEIIIPKATIVNANKRKAQGHQEALNTKKTKTVEEPEPVVELDLNHVTSGESVEESEEGIEGYNDADVLAGRGGSINVHPGNIKFRMLIDQRRREYLQARKTVKPQINKSIVNIIRRKYGGRFLKRESDGLWYEIGDDRAQEKVGQAFRQKAPEMRKILFGDQTRPQVELQELQQAQEQRNQIELQHLLEQGHRQQLEQQVQQQLQLHQHQIALASASQGTTTAVNPTMLLLLNPLLQLQQQQQQAAMANPLYNALFITNNIMAPVVNPVGVQVPTSAISPTVTTTFPATTMDNNASNATLEQLRQAFTGTGRHVLPTPPTNPHNGPL